MNITGHFITFKICKVVSMATYCTQQWTNHMVMNYHKNITIRRVEKSAKLEATRVFIKTGTLRYNKPQNIGNMYALMCRNY